MENNPEGMQKKRQARGGETKSKRQERREEIQRQERKQRITIIAVVGVLALLIISLGIIPAFRKASNSEVPEFKSITPLAYENVNGFSMGDPNAKVKVDVFEDFKCGGCATYSETREPLIYEQFVKTGQVLYTYYQFPFLDDAAADKQSDRASNASLCASEQGRFWDYKKMIFTNQGLYFNEALMVAFAEDLGLDANEFEACLSENRYQSTIDEHLALGDQREVGGTPTVYVNGERVVPANEGQVVSFEEIAAAILAALGGQ
jgi:protein-disulfide isomerase